MKSHLKDVFVFLAGWLLMAFLATGWLQLSKIKKFLNLHTNSVISKINKGENKWTIRLTFLTQN